MNNIPDLPDLSGWLSRNGVSLAIVFVLVSLFLGILGAVFGGSMFPVLSFLFLIASFIIGIVTVLINI